MGGCQSIEIQGDFSRREKRHIRVTGILSGVGDRFGSWKFDRFSFRTGVLRSLDYCKQQLRNPHDTKVSFGSRPYLLLSLYPALTCTHEFFRIFLPSLSSGTPARPSPHLFLLPVPVPPISPPLPTLPLVRHFLPPLLLAPLSISTSSRPLIPPPSP